MDKTFDARAAEPRLYAAWEAAGAFRAGANATRPETFCIMIPPPNVTGALHVGHAFNNTIQDILVRWHRMRGFDTLWQPGQDHAGIATQLMVERELKATGQPGRRELGREAFLGKVWEWKAKYGSTIIGQLKRLGSSCDWERNAFTMSGAPGAPAGEEGNFHDAVIRVFVEMYEKGLIYRGKRLVNWDPHFETAISDLEVENIETPGHMWHFKYPLANGATYTYTERDAEGTVLFEEVRDYISIATTRPETMLGDGAVAVHPSDARYAPIVGMLCEIPVGPKAHRRLIPIIADEYPDPAFGSGAVKITGAHDFNDYQVAKRAGIPLYRLMDTQARMRKDGAPHAEAAAIAQGVARGERTLSEAEADAVNLVPDHLRGLDRLEARARVIAEITAEGLAVMTEATDPRLGRAAGKAPLESEEGGAEREAAESLVPLVEARPIMQPHGDRSKVVIEPMLTDQWFVDAGKVVGPALEAVRSGRTKILPESGEKTYYHWLENIEPWCISRQLWWGHQIPVWYGPSERTLTGTGSDAPLLACAASVEEAGRKAFETCARQLAGRYDRIIFVEDLEDLEAGFPAGEAGYARLRELDLPGIGDARRFEAEGAQGPGPFALIRARDSGERIAIIGLSRDPDVLDTWFSSGLWPLGTLGWPADGPEMRYFPTDVLVTGFDILFFWVARMMMMQLAVAGEVPFHTVYLHQLVRDEKGKKMSKTAGNVIDPLEIIDEYGADALRMTNAAMASLGGVLKLSRERIAGYRNFGTKLWNAARFAEMNGVFALPPRAAPPAPANVVNRWILGETAKVRELVDEAFGAYRFNEAALGLYAFVWGKVCDWYVEFAKPLLDGPDAQETRETMRWVLDQCLVLLHPVMPFITEEIWGQTGGPAGARAKMLVHADWPTCRAADLVDPEADREMNWVIGLIEEIRSSRAQLGVPAGLKLPLVLAEADTAARAAIARNEALIFRLARIDSLTETAIPKGAVAVPVAGALLGLPLAGVIDVAAETARLGKALAKVEKEAEALRGRLGNPKFVSNAAEEVIAEAQDNLALREEEAAKIAAALARLRALS